MAIQRSSGILMPIASLPSPYGIGTFGKAAYEFVDFLAESKQCWWQILPLGPTSYGDSPYQSFSTFAGNPYFVDLELLIEDGLLERSECDEINWGDNPSHIEYGILYEQRFQLLQKVCDRGYARDAEVVKQFAEENNSWLPDYTLFMALKRHFGMKAWTEWPEEDIRLHKAEAVEKYREMLQPDVQLFEYIQYLFFKQWNELRAYAREKNVGIIGDLPIYVAMDSADVWSEPHWFLLDEKNVPIEVSGVPPDCFTEDGQLWGNPLYRWDDMQKDGYGWWIRRVGGARKMYDILRIDHFRGFEAYWAVPYGEKTAKNGRWIKGPGMSLIRVLTSWFKDVEFIAEDLGYVTEELGAFLKESGLPGMKVLEFAFDSREASDYLPHCYPQNCVCYVGTHDNATLQEWKETAAPEDVAVAERYLGLNKKEGFNTGIIRGGMSSVANLFVVQMQDWLELGPEGRINIPGNPSGNWCWRMSPDVKLRKLAPKIATMTKLYGRCPRDIKEQSTCI